MSFIISGIHTGIGKTICAAVICEALGLDYWKPVQAGDLENTDSQTINRLTSNTKVYKERYKLAIPASPHFAAKEENLTINVADFSLPRDTNGLIVETAGGLLSPLSDVCTNLDLIKHLGLPNILVSNNYLGSINHTMLSLKVLEQWEINTVGIIFCGETVTSTNTYIAAHTLIPILCSVPHFDELSTNVISQYASTISSELKRNLYAK